MIEQQGRVTAVDGDDALVVIVRQSACGSCQAKSGCGTSLVGSLFPERRISLRLRNSQQAKAGERVIVGLPEAGLQRASLLLYGLPLLTLLLGAVGAQSVAQANGWSAEPAAILGGLFGMVMGLYGVRRLSRGAAMRPVMLRRLPGNEISLDALEILQYQQARTTEK